MSYFSCCWRNRAKGALSNSGSDYRLASHVVWVKKTLNRAGDEYSEGVEAEAKDTEANRTVIDAQSLTT